jgi:hypothetical protein
VTGKIMTTEFEKDDFKMRLFIKKCKYNSWIVKWQLQIHWS